MTTGYIMGYGVTYRYLVKSAHLIEFCHILGEEHVAHGVDGFDARREDALRGLGIFCLWHQLCKFVSQRLELGGIFSYLQLNIHRLLDVRVSLFYRLQRVVHVVHHHHHDFALCLLLRIIIDDALHCL